MKNVFADKSLKSFYEYMKDFSDSLKTTFPECGATKDWCLWFNNILLGDEEKMKQCVEKWVDAVEAPLIKGCAKYSKAVASITGKPAMVYHALMYHDIEAADASSEYFRDLCLPAKLKDTERMDEEATKIFWEYMEELNKHAYGALRKSPPSVPTSSDIAEDIQRRRAKTSSATGLPSGPVLQQGVVEIWNKLCSLRKVTGEDFSSATLGKQLFELANQPLETGTEETVADACRARSAAAFHVIVAACPYLNASPMFEEEEWCLVDKAFALCTMEGSIPQAMMSGIENVANRLVKDISEGRTNLASLNVEAIGQQVMSSVSSEDMSTFSNNLDKIIPAIQRMQ